MSTFMAGFHTQAIQRTLCVVTIVLMAVAVLYAAWICIQNFSRIGV